MSARLNTKILLGAVGYGVWALMAYIDPAQRADFLHFNVLMATGVIGLALRDMQQPPPPPPPPPHQPPKDPP